MFLPGVIGVYEYIHKVDNDIWSMMKEFPLGKYNVRIVSSDVDTYVELLDRLDVSLDIIIFYFSWRKTRTMTN